MKKDLKTKQIAVRFAADSYEKINKCAKEEHRGLGAFVRHATLFYVKNFMEEDASVNRRGGLR